MSTPLPMERQPERGYSVLIFWALYALGIEYLFLDQISTGIEISAYTLVSGQVWTYIGIFAGFIPLCMYPLVVALKALPRPWRNWIQNGLFYTLLYTCIRNALNPILPLEQVLQLGVAVLVTILAGILIHKLWGIARDFLTFLSVAIIAVPLYFISLPGLSNHLFPETLQTTADALNNKTPVFLIIFDEFPVTHLLRDRTHIEQHRFPNFYRFSQHATFYPNTLSQAAFTFQSIPSILTGQLPTLVPNAKADDVAGKKCLRQAKGIERDKPGLYQYYDLDRVYVYHHGTKQCPTEQCKQLAGYPKETIINFPVFLLRKKVQRIAGNFLTDELVQGLVTVGAPLFGGADTSLEARLRDAQKRPSITLATQDNPFSSSRFRAATFTPSAKYDLYVLHVAYPHHPFYIYGSGRFLYKGSRFATLTPTLCSPASKGLDEGCLRPEEIPAFYQGMLYQAQMADTELGTLLARIQNSGLYDKALIMVTADHGITFTPNESLRFAQKHLLSDIASVPLFVKFPGQQRGQTRLDLRYLTDIFPTIATTIGIPKNRLDGPGIPLQTVSTTRPKQYMCSVDDYFPLDHTVADAKLKTIQTRLTLFGADAENPSMRLLTEPNARRWLGKSIQRIPKTHLASQAITIINPASHVLLPKGGNSVPGVIEGIIRRQKAKPGETVIITVNDVIQAVTRTYLDDETNGQPVFTTVVPESAFKTGPNRIEAFVYTP